MIQQVFSQCISIELSIHWDRESDVFKPETIVCVPKLNIVYRNNSNANYYFQKVSTTRAELPIIPIGTSLQYPVQEYLNPDYLKRAKLHGKYTNQNFNVLIGGTQLYQQGWFVENDTVIQKEREIDLINDDLSNIYEYIFRKNNAECNDSIQKIKTYFSGSDLSVEGISDKVKDQFVFLKPGESYTDIINLIGFKAVGGIFTFIINEDSLTDFIYTEPNWDKKLGSFCQAKVILPIEVDGYKLYSGAYNSNQVVVSF